MLFLRHLPWWAFATGAVLAGAVALPITRDHLAESAALEAAIAAPPPVIALADLPGAPDHPPFSEFAVRDFGAFYTGIVDSGRRGRAFLVLSSTTTPPVHLAFTAITLREEMLAEEAARIEQDWDGRVVRGLLTGSTLHRTELIAFLSETAPEITPDSVFLMAEFLGDDREAALRDHVESGRMTTILFWAVTGALALVALWKFVAWVRRRARRPPPLPQRVDTSPIKSRRPR